VLDIQCLNEGMFVLGKQLDLNLTKIKDKIQYKCKSSNNKIKHHSTPTREIIGYDDVYEYLIEKDKWGIKLYEYSKTISTINCSDISDGYTGRR
jgi:hypothetical protein